MPANVNVRCVEGPEATAAIADAEQRVRRGEWVMLLGSIDPTAEEVAASERLMLALERDDAEIGPRAVWRAFWENHPDPLFAYEAIIGAPAPSVSRRAQWDRVFHGRKWPKRLMPYERRGHDW